MLDHTAPHHLLADLKRQRADLGETVARLHETRNRLRQAEDAESVALAAIGALGRDELAAMTAWATDGGGAPAPTIDHGRRTELTRHLAMATAAAEAARGAGRGVDAQMTYANAQAAALERAIDEAAVDAVLLQFEADRVDLEEAVTDLRARVGRVYAALRFLQERADAQRGQGRTAEATALFRTIESALGTPMPSLEPTNADVAAGASLWVARFEDLTR